jgi:anti-sigma B factor antagonist
MPLNVGAQERAKGEFVVAPAGSIDSTTYKALEGALEKAVAARPRVLILDMKSVEFISSVGVGVIFKTRKAIAKTGGQTLMVNLPPRIQKVFDIINALPAQQIFASIAELDAYLAKIQGAM